MHSPTEGLDLLTVDDAMRLFKLKRRTILRAMGRGELVGARFGNRLRFRPDALRAWLGRAEGGGR